MTQAETAGTFLTYCKKTMSERNNGGHGSGHDGDGSGGSDGSGHGTVTKPSDDGSGHGRGHDGDGSGGHDSDGGGGEDDNDDVWLHVR